MGNKFPSRTFGVEIELAGLSQEQAYLALRLAGLPVSDPSRHDGIQLSKWRFHHDGSIRDDRASRENRASRTVEVVSPILSGVDGLKALRKALGAIRKMGGYVNSSCGLHVHVGSQDLTPSEVISVVTRYGAHERAIDSFVIPSRRGSRNRYCQSVVGTEQEMAWSTHEGYLKSELQNVERVLNEVWMDCHTCRRHYDRTYNLPGEERMAMAISRSATCPVCNYSREDLGRQKAHLEQQIARGSWESARDMASRSRDRYRKVNVLALPRHGTLEFRQHYATLDEAKVCAWVHFVVNFVETSKRAVASVTQGPKTRTFKDRGPLMNVPTHVRKHLTKRTEIRSTQFRHWT